MCIIFVAWMRCILSLPVAREQFVMYRGSQKTTCICTESSSRGSRANRHSSSNDARHSGASRYSSVCPHVLAAPAF